MGERLPEIIAIDFDGTLVKDEFPEIGAPYWNVINKIKRLQEKGVAVILWTCRSGSHLTDAIIFCNELGLIFNSVNENLKHIQEKYNTDTRKVYADYYIDDKSLSMVEVNYMDWWNSI